MTSAKQFQFLFADQVFLSTSVQHVNMDASYLLSTSKYGNLVS